jgi:hypothetical protein
MSKKPQASKKTSPKPASKKGSTKAQAIHCTECDKKIAAKEQALFVEEEVGRFFCSESCIVANFTPDIQKLEREYGKHVSANDLTSEERERFAHLRWMALEQPDEVWVEKVASGDSRYTLISEFKPEKKAVYSVAICLMLRGEPSFLYLAFVSSDRYLVDAFRKGEKLKVVRKNSLNPEPGQEAKPPVDVINAGSTEDRLAEPWTEADSVRASIIRNRGGDDIAVEDFGFYQNCLEETLQEPSELWSYLPKAAKRAYHFIRRYDHDKNFWYVVIAKDTADETQIEIVDAFPTNDEKLIQMCRHGRKEILGNQQGAEANDLKEASGGRRNVH